MNGTWSTIVIKLTSIPSSQLWQPLSAAHSGAVLLNFGMERGHSTAWTCGRCAFTSSRYGRGENMNGSATWTRVRRHMTRPDSCPDAICRRCSTDEIETDFHRIWSCPANRAIDGIEKSQHLLAEASRHWKSCPVFWLRGCIPSTWTRPGCHRTCID